MLKIKHDIHQQELKTIFTRETQLQMSENSNYITWRLKVLGTTSISIDTI